MSKTTDKQIDEVLAGFKIPPGQMSKTAPTYLKYKAAIQKLITQSRQEAVKEAGFDLIVFTNEIIAELQKRWPNSQGNLNTVDEVIKAKLKALGDKGNE
jgi:hypothetical protein